MLQQYKLMLPDLVHSSCATHSSHDRFIWDHAVFCILCRLWYGRESIVFWRAAWSISFFCLPKLLRTITTRFNASFLLRVSLLAQHSMFPDIQAIKTWSHVARMRSWSLRFHCNQGIVKKTPLLHIKWGFFRVTVGQGTNSRKSPCRNLNRYTTSLWCHRGMSTSCDFSP